MAAPPTFTIRDNMIQCGLDDDPTNLFDVETQAERIADDIFEGDFNSAMIIDFAQLSRDFKSYSALTVNEGRIRVKPR